MKRFQECNRLVKVFRYRWYILIPFEWLWFRFIKPMKVWEDDWTGGTLGNTGKYSTPDGKTIWKILLGTAQSRMRWFYTYDEVMKRLHINDNSK